MACCYVVASMIWKMSIFNGVRFGLANTVLRAFGFEGRQWLSRPHPPLYWLVIVSERLWLQVGFYMILFLAGLQRIPRTSTRRRRSTARGPDGRPSGYITFPQLRATSAAVLVLLLINAFQAFDEFFNLLSNGAGTYPPYARPPLVYLYYLALGAGPGLRPRQRRRRDPDAPHRRVRPRPGSPARLREAGQLWLRSDRAGRGRRSASAVLYGVLVVAAILFLVPFYLIVRNGLSSDLEISSPHWKLFPTSCTGATSPTCSTTPACRSPAPCAPRRSCRSCRRPARVLIASMAGYGLARIPYRFAGPVFVAIIATLMIPAAVTFVPSFIIIATIGWLNTYRV